MGRIKNEKIIFSQDDIKKIINDSAVVSTNTLDGIDGDDFITKSDYIRWRNSINGKDAVSAAPPVITFPTHGTVITGTEEFTVQSPSDGEHFIAQHTETSWYVFEQAERYLLVDYSLRDPVNRTSWVPNLEPNKRYWLVVQGHYDEVSSWYSLAVQFNTAPGYYSLAEPHLEIFQNGLASNLIVNTGNTIPSTNEDVVPTSTDWKLIDRANGAVVYNAGGDTINITEKSIYVGNLNRDNDYRLVVRQYEGTRPSRKNWYDFRISANNVKVETHYLGASADYLTTIGYLGNGRVLISGSASARNVNTVDNNISIYDLDKKEVTYRFGLPYSMLGGLLITNNYHSVIRRTKVLIAGGHYKRTGSSRTDNMLVLESTGDGEFSIIRRDALSVPTGNNTIGWVYEDNIFFKPNAETAAGQYNILYKYNCNTDTLTNITNVFPFENNTTGGIGYNSSAMLPNGDVIITMGYRVTGGLGSNSRFWKASPPNYDIWTELSTRVPVILPNNSWAGYRMHLASNEQGQVVAFPYADFYGAFSSNKYTSTYVLCYDYLDDKWQSFDISKYGISINEYSKVVGCENGFLILTTMSTYGSLTPSQITSGSVLYYVEFVV